MSKHRKYRLENIPLTNQAARPSDIKNTKASPSTSLSLAVHDRQHSDETNAEVLFQNIVIFCRENRTNFVDDQFPPIPRSIGHVESLNNHPLKWLRISQISPLNPSDLNSRWSIYSSSPKPSDIQQGALGDCWLMAALALITERPRMLAHILLTKHINKEGAYLLRLCHNGLWKTVIVDDCFPCTQNNQLAFTQAHHRQLYVPLIEKACAKLYGSYAELIGGQTEEGLQLLTGAPCDHIDLHSNEHPLDADIVWAKLLSACESHLLIGAATGRTNISIEEYARNNIPNNHAFSVLAAYSVPNVSISFVLVRDPHAHSNYRDEFMKPPIFEQLSRVSANTNLPGAFWISWSKFVRFFNSITISSYADNYYDIREVDHFTHSAIQWPRTFQFFVPETSLVNISLLYHRHNRREHNFHTQSFVLCNVEQGAAKDVGTSFAILCTKRGAVTQWIGSLRSGFYVLIPFSTSFWSDETRQNINYTLIIHSKVQINVQYSYEPPTLLTDCLIATVMKNSDRKKMTNDYNYYVTTKQYDFAIFIAENLSSTDFLNVEMDLNDSICVRNSRKSLSTYDCIPPRHRQIIFLIEWTHQYGQNAKMEYLHRHQHVKQSNSSVPDVYINQSGFHSYRPF